MDKEISIEEVYERLISIESQLFNQKAVLNFDEVSKYTGFSKSYLYKLSCSGGIPCFKPNGKHIFFNKNEIDNWLLQNRKATNAEIDSKAATYVALNKKGGRK
jgi:excisionase family DNA binding protein